MTIRAILYDLDGTLRIGRPLGRQFFADRVTELGIAITDETRRRAARWEHSYWAESAELRADRALFGESEAFWANYSSRQLLALGVESEQAKALGPQINRYMSEHFHPEDVLMQGVQETLTCLRETGLTLGVISNREEPFGEYLNELGIGEYFDFSLAAGDVNGDNYYADVVGARNAGLNPVLIDPENLFDAPGCPVIQSHHELIPLLEQRELWPGNEK
ncbi:MAG: HAD family hydrolase [Chloroflexi bacterium]|nr:HAD family hydrolase [Chloroflexota bacterium]